MPPELTEKRDRLEQRLRELDSVMVAYSGGIDSAFLAWSARKILGNSMLAVLADSPSLARRQLNEAVKFAVHHDIPLKIISTAEMENPDYVKNDAMRCFHCKGELFTVMSALKKQLGFKNLAYGMNLDDCVDFRPGQKAAEIRGVTKPLVDAGLTKLEIRDLAYSVGLEIWDKPSSACLSSRLAYGQTVTKDKLSRVELSEDFLFELGFRQYRVRDHGEIARIEIDRKEIVSGMTLERMEEIAAKLKSYGFRYVTLDCEGYRSGSMNEALSIGTLETI